MASFEEDVAKLNIKSIIITTILSALGFLVALSWRDAIQKTIEIFVPSGEGLSYMYFAAFIITVISVVIAVILLKIQKADLIPSALEKKIRRVKEEDK